MKIRVTHKCGTSKKAKFPVLKKWIPRNKNSKDKELIVLFTDLECGFAIASPTAKQIGFYDNNWICCEDSRYWEDFDGEVVLSNK